jgi:RNA polymerase sigma-70 factor (ECF subfamily)
MSEIDPQKPQPCLTRPSSLQDPMLMWLDVEANLRAFVASTVWDVHHAEDVLQEIALVVNQRWSAYDPARPLLPWCLAIARLKILEYLRSQSRDRMQLSEGIIHVLEDASAQIPGQDLRDRRTTLQNCIQQLKGRLLEVIELRYLRELNVDAIAQQVGTTNGVVRVTLHRARASLRDCVSRSLAVEEQLQ